MLSMPIVDLLAEGRKLAETGLRVRVTRVLDIISGREHARGADFIIVYLATVVGGELKPDDDADAVEWFERSNLPQLAFRATQVVLARDFLLSSD